jgi:hypothetical protein
MNMQTNSGLPSGTSSRTQAGNYVDDGYVAGKIGKRNLLDGCFSFLEAWTLAARQIVLDGRYAEAKATLDAGATVRSLLRDWYGVFSESVSSDTAFYETKAFRRTMRNALRSTNS